MAALDPAALRSGLIIRERRESGQERRVGFVLPDRYITATGVASGRTTTIRWANLKRYEIVTPEGALS